MSLLLTLSSLLKDISRLLEGIHSDPGIEEYVIVHAAARERAENFAVLVEKIIGKKPLYITDISPVVGMHSGKGAVAIGFIEKVPG
ncbi:MAG: DegV family protein [Spirochaetales bacterium]|nr:DegV family protein [Spirochaetales bacterium]